jgi:phage-related protein
MNTKDINTATKVWRWNNGGLGFSSTGYYGIYGTAITNNGAIDESFL